MANWNEFEKLPGSARTNFEYLCRALIRLQFGACGEFAGLSNQPGVEFHLRIRTTCALGAAGRWYGWQCKWFDLPPGRALGATRRKEIARNLATSRKELPNLTDWVLWTRHTLTKSDQKWFRTLGTNPRLALWTSIDAEALLGGDGEILRQTYFGELVLSPSILAREHDVSVAQVRKRWLPEAHQPIDAERELRQLLGEAASWSDLANTAEQIARAIREISDSRLAVGLKLKPITQPFIRSAQGLARALRDVHALVERGDVESLRERLGGCPTTLAKGLDAAPRRLRAARLRCGLDATNAYSDMKRAIALFAKLRASLATTLVGVLADAGGGKTQLSAQITAPVGARPAGILLHGRELHSGRTLNDLAKSVTIRGLPIPSVEALVSALDAAGKRARCRLPLVIDGLNEAEDPRAWKPMLASLQVLLRSYPNVLGVCTLRTGARRPQPQAPGLPAEDPAARDTFVKQALPDDVRFIEIEDLGDDTVSAVRRYFQYFKINGADADLPLELLRHPLTLRMFCEVTNPSRANMVGVEAMPRSLTGLFDRYLESAIERIAELAPRSQRYFQQDVSEALQIVGRLLWEAGSRELPQASLRASLGDHKRPWNESIVHLLEQEGVLLRVPGDVPSDQYVIPLYDALGGHIVADAMVKLHGSAGVEPWLNDAKTREAFGVTGSRPHPLAQDVFRGLAGLLPRRLHGKQLWQIADSSLRDAALDTAATLEGQYVDSLTVAAVSKVLTDRAGSTSRLLARLFHTRAAERHPFNADFLNSVLTPLSVAERDLLWTEWVRGEKWIRKDVRQCESLWRSRAGPRTVSDELRATWIKWLLTTTDRELRDSATRAIYWFGRADPSKLFDAMERAAEVNDPYVIERVLASSYGVAMAAQCDPHDVAFRTTTLRHQGRRVYELFFQAGGRARTTHALTREYARRFVELAAIHHRKQFPRVLLADARPPFANGGQVLWPEAPPDSEDIYGPDSPFRMDFQNYTLGRLVPRRHNYDFKHEDYRLLRARILWRVEQLGWTPDRFKRIDHDIETRFDDYGRRTRDGDGRIDRYGKKYSWIAYFEMQGWLSDRGELKADYPSGRPDEIDIDPSFPEPPRDYRVVLDDLLGSQGSAFAKWIDNDAAPRIAPLLRQRSLLGEQGPWVALDGHVDQQDEARGRRVFMFVRSVLVPRAEVAATIRLMRKHKPSDRVVPDPPSCDHAFAGELPWCETFPRSTEVTLKLTVSQRKVKVRRREAELLFDGAPFQWSDLSNNALERLEAEAKAAEADPNAKGVMSVRFSSRRRYVETEEIRRETRSVSAIIPVCAFSWPTRTDGSDGAHGTVLARRLARMVKLWSVPQSLDLSSTDGLRATIGTAFRGNDYWNGERFFYIRQTVLGDVLKKLRMDLLWVVWGERSLSNNRLDSASRNRESSESRYKVFQSIIHFRPAAKRARR